MDSGQPRIGLCAEGRARARTCFGHRVQWCVSDVCASCVGCALCPQPRAITVTSHCCPASPLTPRTPRPFLICLPVVTAPRSRSTLYRHCNCHNHHGAAIACCHLAPSLWVGVYVVVAKLLYISQRAALAKRQGKCTTHSCTFVGFNTQIFDVLQNFSIFILAQMSLFLYEFYFLITG